ncbi:hypothetical protein [Chitinophaga sp.]|uniref:hypothetical protein n=1 Tax=Chitinophaga sp. TaxID=1869181 RepID=UPI0031E1F53F
MTFASIDLLRATPPQSGEIYDVLGYYTPGDGGGGSFYWDSTSGENPEPGMIVASGQHVFGNLAATRSFVKIYFTECTVKGTTSTSLFNTMYAAYQGLDVEVYNIRSTFTNVMVNAQSPLLEIKYKNF